MSFVGYDETSPRPSNLLNKKSQWVWDSTQEQAFQEVKQSLSSSPVLALYDPSLETVVSADASSFGLGAVLLQREPEQEWRPVALYISRAMTSTETRYAQIEKEALALTWACERFVDYVIGLKFHIYTDHKPLVPLLGSKRLEELPLRVQRFRMRLMRFDFSISHVPGKELITADALSRAPVSPGENDLDEEVSAYISLIVNSLPATEKRLQEIRRKQEKDEVC